MRALIPVLVFTALADGADRKPMSSAPIHLDAYGKKWAERTLRKMTPEEMIEALSYRPPGVPETDMTGMFADLLPKPAESQPVESKPTPRAKRAAKTV